MLNSSWSTQPLHVYCGLWIIHVIDSLYLPEYTKMIGLKRIRHLFGAEKLEWFLLVSGIDNSGECK